MGRHGENIRKRNDGRWEGRYKVFDERKGRNIYRSVYGRTYGEAKEKLSRARLESVCQNVKKQEGTLADIPVNPSEHDMEKGTVILFSQAAEEWLLEISKKRERSTYVKYDNVYQSHLSSIVGSCQLSAATDQEPGIQIRSYISEKQLSESLQKSICCIANQILDFANKKYSLSIPLMENPPIKSVKRTAWTLSEAEQSRLFQCLYQKLDKFKIAVLLCLYTGLRLGELCSLQWADIDTKDMTLTVNRTVQRIAVKGCITRTILLETNPKSESSKRIIPMTAEMTKLLIQLKGCQPYVFGGEKPLDPRTMQYRFKKILKTAEIRERNFHLLRHTFATNCIENNMDVKTLSEILGHSDVKITLNRYVHPTLDSKRRQLGMLSDFYGQICGQVA